MPLDYKRVRLENGAKVTRLTVLEGMEVIDEPAVSPSGTPLVDEPAPATKAAATRRASSTQTSVSKRAASTTAAPSGAPTTTSGSADAGAVPASEEDSK